MSINAGLCSKPLETRVKEKVQITQSLINQSYNFPLYLHKKEIVADFCVSLDQHELLLQQLSMKVNHVLEKQHLLLITAAAFSAAQ